MLKPMLLPIYQMPMETLLPIMPQLVWEKRKDRLMHEAVRRVGQKRGRLRVERSIFLLVVGKKQRPTIVQIKVGDGCVMDGWGCSVSISFHDLTALCLSSTYMGLDLEPVMTLGFKSTLLAQFWDFLPTEPHLSSIIHTNPTP